MNKPVVRGMMVWVSLSQWLYLPSRWTHNGYNTLGTNPLVPAILQLVNSEHKRQELEGLLHKVRQQLDQTSAEASHLQ